MSKKEIEIPVVSPELARSFEVAKHTIQGIRTMLNTDFMNILKLQNVVPWKISNFYFY
ncbi:hypothetical protein M3M38_07315 [Fructilactobacillus cliffordii]|uniref:hypothetical protein n=1 Tax=Fructilactobacillus cliffordii TaxID=2940299 RepID=UPI002092C945|nr:hypothetical protein [Fructilactobacillus cliffordii]USS86468.1 hypothetical protein M3M38_07315 [Fructilactobacillus cliffordii]